MRQFKKLQKLYNTEIDYQIQCEQVQLPSIEPLKKSNQSSKGVQISQEGPSYNTERIIIKRNLGQKKGSVPSIRELKPKKSYLGKSLIGGNETQLAMKNHNSYFIGTRKKGFTVIENGYQVNYGMLPVYKAALKDVLYIPCLDCYFMDYNEKLYRKDIDNKPPYPYMDDVVFGCSYRCGGSFIYSEIHQRVIFGQHFKYISVLNPQTREIELEVDLDESLSGDLSHFRMCGDEEDKVISVNDEGHIILYHLDYERKLLEVTATYQVALIEERWEMPLSLAVCEKGKYAFLEIGQDPCLSSRIFIFVLSENRLIQRASIDRSYEEITVNLALECFGYIGRHIVWVGLSMRDGIVQVFDFHTQTHEFMELKDMRVSHLEEDPEKIYWVGDKFYFTGRGGRVMMMSIKS